MKLRKDLGLIHVFCIASGAMISSGIFVLPGLAHAQAGPAVVLSYLIAGFLAAMGMLSVAELATAMPKAGGDYFFITRGMGPAVGSVAGLLTWFSLSLKSAFALVGMAAFATLFVDVDRRILGVLLCAVFVLINLVGAKHAGRFQVVLVMGLLAIMSLYIVRGLPAIELRHLEPFAPNGFHSVLFTAGFVFVAYGGLLKVVTAVFSLMGTADERHFHLRSLANIVQIIQQPDFEKKWLAAQREQALRDLVLLGERQREG